MKWYSHPTYIAHKKAIVHYNKGIGKYYEWVIKIANQFNREYASIGVLDVNDLIAAGNIGLVNAWNKIDWEIIGNSTEPDASLWSYIKKRIKWEIRREIDKHSQHISTPINKVEKMRKNMSFEDQIFCDLFPNFFDTAFPDYIENMRPWDQEQLTDVLNSLIDKYIHNHKHQEILKLSYGIDTIDDKPVAIKQLAERFNMSEIGIKKIRSRSLAKLNNEDVEKIIEKFYENLYS